MKIEAWITLGVAIGIVGTIAYVGFVVLRDRSKQRGL